MKIFFFMLIKDYDKQYQIFLTYWCSNEIISTSYLLHQISNNKYVKFSFISWLRMKTNYQICLYGGFQFPIISKELVLLSLGLLSCLLSVTSTAKQQKDISLIFWGGVQRRPKNDIDICEQFLLVIKELCVRTKTTLELGDKKTYVWWN